MKNYKGNKKVKIKLQKFKKKEYLSQDADSFFFLKKKLLAN